jgi:hypothetical protein
MPEPKIYRYILDVLLREFEESAAPTYRDNYPARILSCAWGLYAHIHRMSRAVRLLVDSSMPHEAVPLARSVLEYTIVLHWIIERGEAGVDAMLANQRKRVNAFLEHAKGTSLMIPPKFREELESADEGVDEEETMKAFEQICRDTGSSSLYAAYSFMCMYTHPTVSISNSYVVEAFREPTLSTKPSGNGLADGSLALMAHCLIWAGRDFDRLTPGHPREKDLELLANQLDAANVLPPYNPKPPPGRRPGRRGRMNARNKNKYSPNAGSDGSDTA